MPERVDNPRIGKAVDRAREQHRLLGVCGLGTGPSNAAFGSLDRGGPACERACPHGALTRINLNNLDALAKWLRR